MSTFTGRELEFLAGLDKSWWWLSTGESSRACAFAPELRACEKGAR